MFLYKVIYLLDLSELQNFTFFLTVFKYLQGFIAYFGQATMQAFSF